METPDADIDALFGSLGRSQYTRRVCESKDGEVRTYEAKRLVPLPEGLEGQRTSDAAIIHEKPEHRIILWLKAQGYSAKEIEKATGFSYGHVRTIIAQPWFRERIGQIINEIGRDAVKAKLQGEVLPSIELLTSVRDNEKARHADRIAASRELLDRFLGKPTVKVESENRNIHTSISADRARLEEEARQNEEALRARGITIVPSKS